MKKIKRNFTNHFRWPSGQEFIWGLERSANLKIQYVDVSVRDLDITTNAEGIKFLELP
ncbi:MAG: hypothetical protein QXG86_02540 [Candidatus Woesearchaeota archaeon]